MIDNTHSETRKILKNDFVVLARGGCRRGERRERHGLSGGGGGRAIGETSIIGTGREGRRRTRPAPGGLAATWNGDRVNGRGEMGKGGRLTGQKDCHRESPSWLALAVVLSWPCDRWMDVEEREQVSRRRAKRVQKAIMVNEDMDGAGRKIVARGLV